MAAGDQYYGSMTANTSNTYNARLYECNNNGTDNHTRDGVTWYINTYNTAGDNTATTYIITGSGNANDGYGGYLVTGTASLYNSSDRLLSANGTMTFTWGSGGSTGWFVFPGAGVFEVPQAFAAGGAVTGGIGIGFIEE